MYRSCDVADAAAVAAVAADLDQCWGPLLGVVHCSGGVNDIGSVRRRTWTAAQRVLAPKVAGSLNLVRLAKDRRADFAVLVASIAGSLPEAGRGVVDYALANAFQLALAEHEHDEVTAVTAHAWPNWAGVGLEPDPSFAARHSVTAARALLVHHAHLRSGGYVVIPGAAVGAPDASAPGGATPAPKAAVGPSSLDEALGQVAGAFLDVLGEVPGEVGLDRLGLDSVTIAGLTVALERRSGRTVDPSVLMRAHTTRDVAAALLDGVGPEPRAAMSDPPGGAAAGEPAPAPSLSALLRPLLA